MSDSYLETRRCSVTRKQFRTPRKSYRLSRIEKVSLSRRTFYMWLPIGAGMLSFQHGLSELLYPHEKLAITGTAIVLTLLTWNLGAIVIQSKALSEIAMVGWYGGLRKVKAALDDALADNAEDML